MNDPFKDPSLSPKKYNAPQDGNIDLNRIKSVFGPDFQRFYEEHQELIWLMGAFVILLFTMFSWRPWMDRQHDTRTILASLNSTRMLELKLEYPNGFKLFLLNGTKITPVKHDSLKDSIKLNWSKVQVVNNDGNEVKMQFPEIYFKNKVLTLEQLTPSIFASTDRPYTIITANGIELFIQVLDKKEDQLLCLMSYNVIEEQGVFKNSNSTQ